MRWCRRSCHCTREKNDRYAWNDIGNGNLFADLYKLRTRYVPERSKWAVFDGRIWQFDLGGLAVMQLCKELSDSLMAYALTVTDEKDPAGIHALFEPVAKACLAGDDSEGRVQRIPIAILSV